RLAPRRPTPDIHVTFYPYIGINHTIRVRDGRVYVRVGEICHDMPTACHRGLADMLTGKLLRTKIAPGARELYSAVVQSDAIRERASRNKRERGRKVVTTSKGAVYDLVEMFDELNHQYFGGNLPKPALTWSAKKTYRILGHHDATHDHVAISRSLDSVDVP